MIVGEELSGDELLGGSFALVTDHHVYLVSADKNVCLLEYEQSGGKLNLKRKLGTRGNGPMDLGDPKYFVSGDTLYIADASGMSVRKMLSVPISGDTLNFSRAKATGLPLDNIWYMNGGVAKTTNGILLSGGHINTEELLCEIDLSTGKVVSYSKWFKDNNIPDIPRQMVYLANSLLAVHGNTILYGCDYGRLLELLEVDGEEIVTKRQIYGFRPEISGSDGLNPSIPIESYRGMEVYCTDNRIYVKLQMTKISSESFSLESYKGYPGDYFDEVEIYDWDGNFIECVSTDKPFRTMVVSNDDRFMYVLTQDFNNYEPQIIKYDF